MTEAQRDDLRSYFEDFDGEYYRLTISVAKNENGTMLYNIGKIKKRKYSARTAPGSDRFRLSCRRHKRCIY